MAKQLGLILLFVCTQLVSGVAQGLGTNGARPSPAVQLTQRGIRLDRASLVTALRNPDHEIRNLAAFQLATVHAEEEVPHILEAYAAEDNPLLRMNFAYYVALLRAEEGTRLLKAACLDQTLGTGARLRASFFLAQLKDKSCVDFVLRLISESPESSERAEALFLLPHFAAGDGVTCEQAESAVVKALGSVSGHERSAAVTALVAVCKAQAIPLLQTHLKTEQDQPLREKIERELKDLQKHKPKPQAQ